MKRGFSPFDILGNLLQCSGQNRGPDEEGIFTKFILGRSNRSAAVRIEAPMKRGFSPNGQSTVGHQSFVSE